MHANHSNVYVLLHVRIKRCMHTRIFPTTALSCRLLLIVGDLSTRHDLFAFSFLDLAWRAIIRSNMLIFKGVIFCHSPLVGNFRKSRRDAFITRTRFISLTLVRQREKDSSILSTSLKKEKQKCIKDNRVSVEDCFIHAQKISPITRLAQFDLSSRGKINFLENGKEMARMQHYKIFVK